MLHACFVVIPTCFMCTFIQYLAFSGTNLLTRCRSVNSCFLLFLVSEKLHMKYSRNWTKQKPKFLFFPYQRRRPGGSRRGATGWPGHGQARAHLWPHLGVVWAPWPPPTPPLRPYKLRLGKTLRSSASVHEKSRSRRHRRNQVSGDRTLFRHPAGAGNCPRKPSPSTSPPSSPPLLTPMMRRE